MRYIPREDVKRSGGRAVEGLLMSTLGTIISFFGCVEISFGYTFGLGLAIALFGINLDILGVAYILTFRLR